MALIIDKVNNDISTNTGGAPTLGGMTVLDNTLDFKQSVRVATTAAGTLATSFENGDTVDGVVLATGDRILIKDQAAGAENGIYTVNATGAPTRATDADTDAKVTAGLVTFVDEGTANADKGYILTTNNPITVGTTALTFAEFANTSGAGGDPNYVGEDQSANPSATGTDSLAMGPGAAASTTGSIAIGLNSTASNSVDAIAIGQNADATGSSSIAIGGSAVDANSANATGTLSTAIGVNTVASGQASSAFGFKAQCIGYRAIALGDNAGSQASYAVSIGTWATASGNNSIAIGANGSPSISANATATDAISVGTMTDATATQAVALGLEAQAILIGQHARSSGSFAAAGDAQYSRFVCRGSTTDATATNINPDGGTTNRMILPASTTWVIRLQVVARQDTTNDTKMFEFTGGIKRDGANNTAIVGSISKTILAQDTNAANWDVAVTADDTNEALQVAVTGEAAKTIRWVATVNITEVAG